MIFEVLEGLLGALLAVGSIFGVFGIHVADETKRSTLLLVLKHDNGADVSELREDLLDLFLVPSHGDVLHIEVVRVVLLAKLGGVPLAGVLHGVDNLGNIILAGQQHKAVALGFVFVVSRNFDALNVDAGVGALNHVLHFLVGEVLGDLADEDILFLVGLLLGSSQKGVVEEKSSALLAVDVDVLKTVLNILQILASDFRGQVFVVVVDGSLEVDMGGVELVEHVLLVLELRQLVEEDASLFVDSLSDLSTGDVGEEFLALAREIVDVEEVFSLLALD
jgi:hypothetical protein